MIYYLKIFFKPIKIVSNHKKIFQCFEINHSIVNESNISIKKSTFHCNYNGNKDIEMLESNQPTKNNLSMQQEKHVNMLINQEPTLQVDYDLQNNMQTNNNGTELKEKNSIFMLFQSLKSK